MRSQANTHRLDRSFQVGDWVMLRLQPYRQLSVRGRTSPKLSKRFFGPNKILRVIGPVAYELELPPEGRIHPVFHVSLLRPYQNPSQFPDRPPTNPPPPPVTVNDIPEYEVEHILDHRTQRNQQEYLVKWVGYPDHDATWEPVGNLTHADELLEEYLASRMMLEGGGVM
jgi:hypothetical protein